MSVWHDHYNSATFGVPNHRHTPHCEIAGVDYCPDGADKLSSSGTSYTEKTNQLSRAGWTCHSAFIHLANSRHVSANAFLWQKGREIFLTRELTAGELYNLSFVKDYESAVRRIEALAQEYVHGSIVGKIAAIYERHQKAILAAGAVWLFWTFGGE